MKEILTKAIKKVTLELIYEVVDERTKSILEVVNEIRRRQEEDFRYLNNKIDTQVGQLRQEMGATEARNGTGDRTIKTRDRTTETGNNST